MFHPPSESESELGDVVETRKSIAIARSDPDTDEECNIVSSLFRIGTRDRSRNPKVDCDSEKRIPDPDEERHNFSSPPRNRNSELHSKIQ